MDTASFFDAAKQALETLVPLSKLLKLASDSKKEGLRELFHRANEEARGKARSLSASLDRIEANFKDYGVELKGTLKAADMTIAGWQLFKRLGIRRLTKQLRLLAASTVDFYSDVEAVFTCAEDVGSLRLGVESAYAIRNDLQDLLRNDSSIIEIIDRIRGPLNRVLAEL